MSKLRKNRGLGRGLDALLGPEEPISTSKPNANFDDLPIAQIKSNPFQPRREFLKEQLEELSQSIKIQGVIQPITVRKIKEYQYHIISGERRFRASEALGLKTIPAYIKEADDQQMLEQALIENIQREDLNPIEVALSYQKLIDDCDLTQDALSERLGKKRSTIGNSLRLLKLPQDIQQALQQKTISTGHAKCLLSLQDLVQQLKAFQFILEKSLSVRQTETYIKTLNQEKPATMPKLNPNLALKIKDIQQNLGDRLNTKVLVKANEKNKGEIKISFTSMPELDRILDIIEKEL